MTLLSAIDQTGLTKEIIIADDGSKIDRTEELKSFFQRHHFCDYTIIRKKENKGIVSNCLDAVRHSLGEYVFGIGS